MKKILFIFSLFCFANLFAQKSIPKPNPMRLVNDYAKVLDGYDAEQLEKRLIALDDSTSNQIVVLTIPSLNGEVIEEVANKTFREWGIGNKKTNNGILVLIALQDKKIRIEVGYGLEGAIPDITARSIIDNDLKPAFKQQNYIGGIKKAVEDLSKAAAGEYKVQSKKSKDDGDGSGTVLGVVVILFIVLMIAGNIGKGGKGRGGGGNMIAPLLLANLLGGGGRSSGGWGGGDSGGGFGGFGGGSSGGGGASGGW